MIETEITFEVPFHDVDAMRVVWHGNYARYFEIARCAMMQTVDYDIPQMEASGYAWPVIEMNVRYAQPLTFKQRVRVHARLREWENRLKVAYTIFDAESGKRLTKGYTIQVAVDMSNGELQLESPPVLFERLGLVP